MPARVITAAAAAAVLAFSPVLDAQQPPARRGTAAGRRGRAVEGHRSGRVSQAR